MENDSYNVAEEETGVIYPQLLWISNCIPQGNILYLTCGPGLLYRNPLGTIFDD